jgi:PTS system mannose-specific IID component
MTARPGIPRRTLARVFWRCLFLQAAWNRRGMQNLGFAFAIDPALRALYPEPERRREALRRHLCFFNCHPYTAAAILGGAIHHEERVARGEEPTRGPADYKATLQGPLAAVGDGFFWTALRPFLGAAAALGTLLVGWPAVVAALVLYNALALWLRARLFLAGYRGGDAVVGEISRLALPRAAGRLRDAGAAACGLAAAAVAGRAWGSAGWVAAAVALAAAALGWVAMGRGMRPLPAAYAAAAAGAAASLLATLGRGGP